MAYTNEDLTQLKREVRLHQMASTRMNLKKEGSEYKGKCPFHDDSTPSFTIREGGDGVDLFKCFGCQASGNIYQFISKFDKIGFNEAVEKVAQFAGWSKGKENVEKTFKQVLEKDKPKVTFPLSAMAPAESALESSREARAWLNERGITLDTAKRLHLGFVQSAAAVNPNHPWVNDGWIIWPSIEGNTIVLLKYRSVKGKKTPDGKSAILRKQDMATPLYNGDCVNPFEDVFVVEGEPDTAVVFQAGQPCVGFPNAGFTATPEMRDKLMQANTIYLAGDMDQVGRDTMKKLWAELRDRTYLIDWPEGCKDANDTFLKVCGGNVGEFKAKLDELKQIARQRPIPNFYDLNQVLRTADDTNPMDNPNRLHFPWKEVDRMAVSTPGSVVSSYASYTGSGKTTFWLSVQLNEALKYNSVVLNYSAELSPQELATLTTAILTKKNRLGLVRADYDRAADMMQDARFFVGYNPDISNIKDILGDGTDKHPGLLEWAVRRLGARIVVLDHLHFFTSGDKEATSSEAAAMTRIKNLAVKYGLIFIVIGQSRKANQNSKYKVSEGSDAKGSEALSTDTKIYTPKGLVPIGELVPGDFVIGSDGLPTEVLKVIPQGIRQAYRVNFSDGVSIECDRDHLWAVRSPNGKKRKCPYEVRALKELENLSWKKTGKYSRFRWHIPLVTPVDFKSDAELPLDPYLVGALLGDGTLVQQYPQFTNIDDELLRHVFSSLPRGVAAKKGARCTYRITGERRGPKHPNTLKQKLQATGLWGHKAESKFVPDMYKFRPATDRLQILRGLLDTDGWCGKGGKIRFGTVSLRLAEDVVFLVQSLGGLAKIHRYDRPKNGNFDSLVVCIFLPHHIAPFGISRKADRLCGFKTKNRSIVSIEKTTRKEMVCISVAAKDGLYVTESFIVTHNSFVSTANTTYHLHREIRKDIDPNNPPDDILDPLTSVRLYKCRTKGPGKAYYQLMFDGATGRFVELLPTQATINNID